ncbi:hypothetical protein RFI_27383 [Reticulomyxa filosa]|uniref:Flavin-containing monooxygenase n=1 Tax=Reticulomyxa filosa TaxID=46433 RepID=X6M7V7_RETFI|nr:hypothetical protein RFI_27383 [Reticulomyxa filosa]|eukprot:ETO09994.1 hypothetical protein RFI_27383 [Reticulomyxa filosa]
MELSCVNGVRHITCVYRTPRWYASLWLPDGTPFDQSSRKFGDMDLVRKRLARYSSTLTQYGFKKPSLEDIDEGKKYGGSLYRSFEYWAKKGKISGFHGSVANCDGKNVTLSDGSVINDVDIIMCATGFHPDIPILPRDVFKKIYQPELKERRFLLYLLTFVPSMYDQSLAFVGAQPIVESNPTMFELQARLIGHYWSDVNRELPHASEERQNQWIEKNIITLDYSPLLPDICKQSYHIADDIAEFIGCKPKDPEVVSLLEDAGFIPEQYRIEGPHANPNALTRLKWKLEGNFKDTPQNILKHMRVSATTASVNLYFNRFVFSMAKPFLDYQEKKARRVNRDKEIEKQKF